MIGPLKHIVDMLADRFLFVLGADVEGMEFDVVTDAQREKPRQLRKKDNGSAVPEPHSHSRSC